MAEPNEAGTPQATTPVSESAGTGGTAADGSEQAAKPVDPALAMAWKAKAERVNEVEQRLRDAEARLAAAQQAQYAQAQAADPMVQMVNALREQAEYDPAARAQLATMSIVARQQAETWLTGEMVKAKVPAEKWDTVANLVRESNFQRSIPAAIELASGKDVSDLAKQLEAERKRREELEKVLNARTVNGSGGGNPATTTPAAMSASDTPEMTPDEYINALKTLPPAEAQALRDKGVRFKR